MFILPALLAAAQLLLWPILPLARDAGDAAAGTGVAPGAAAVVVLATLVAAAGLTQRRRRPVHALVVVAAAITAATLAVPAGQYLLVPGDAILVLSLTDLVALYSVAVHRPARTVLVPLGGVVLWQTALTAATDGVAVTDVVLLAAVYVVAAALGRARARWNSERAAAARRLEAARGPAPAG
ncbi:hypothetical protein AB0C07_21725 [Actinoplanes missouriensis]|uniref:hypothetical protein n=1 Tax=Actinoplanes missouriensis TaxID=1866 RepID=UPI0033CD864B